MSRQLATAPRAGDLARCVQRTETEVSVLVYVVLTVAIFAVLGVVQKLVERL